MPDRLNTSRTKKEPRRSVVITAMGFVTVMGSSASEVHESIVKNRRYFTRPKSHPDLAEAAVRHFDIKSFTGRCKETRYLNRGAALATASALSAVRASGLEGKQLEHAGLFTASGPNMDFSCEIPNIRNGCIDDHGLQALFLLKFLPNTATSLISRLCGIHGENMTLGSACAASLMALGEAFRKIRDGYLDLAVAGGGDSRLSSGGLLSYRKAGALWHGNENPDAAYAPFGPDLKGFIPGEGGAFFVLESLDHAEQRNASILAEIKGYGATLDGHAMTAPSPSGFYAEKAVQKALDEANVTPSAVDLVSAHGTGTELNDRMEAAMIRRVFHHEPVDKTPAVTAFKSWTGHLASACGAVELALCLACSDHGLFPGIRNLHETIAPDLDFLTTQRVLRPSHILIQNFGFGGQNCALLVKPWN